MTAVEQSGINPRLRPRDVLLTLFGRHVLAEQPLVSSASILGVMRDAGFGDHAVRSALARMVKRELLQSQRDGRPVYFGLTERSTKILQDGEMRIWRVGAVETLWDGTWTMLSFSLPESWQRQRHDLRVKLTWAGFGALQGGLWIAPRTVRVHNLLEGLEAAAHVRTFVSRADAGVDVAAMIRDVWDIEAIGARYNEFIARWTAPSENLPRRAVARQLILLADWLETIGIDPRLPVEHLPASWPASRAETIFRDLHARLDPAARVQAAECLVLHEMSPM